MTPSSDSLEQWQIHWPAREMDLEFGHLLPPMPGQNSERHLSEDRPTLTSTAEIPPPIESGHNQGQHRRQLSVSTTHTLHMADIEKSSDTLPPKRWHKITRNLRWSIFSVYRRLNLLVLLPNLVAIIVLGAKHHLLNMPFTLVATAVSVNIIVSVLIRQELVINLLFATFGLCPRSWPLWFRRLAAKIYHLGGVHSGAGIAATVWFFVFNAVLAHEWRRNTKITQSAGIFIITGTLDCLLLSIVILAHPHLRAKFHNTFELVHRFAGWLAVILFWVHMIVLANAERHLLNPTPALAKVTFQAPSFLCLLIVTISLVIPWLRLRKVPVHPEPLSDHAVRLHFTHENLPLCAAPRISNSPLKEWHAFAGIPEESGNGYSLLVSNAGDWTNRLIRSPPTSMWVRGIPARGVLHIAPIFKKVVLVATGSGIGPILSLLFAQDLDCRILWSTPCPELRYKRTIINHVLLGDPNAVIIDTETNGRPDLVLEAYKLYKVSSAEAIFVISNPKVTRRVVYDLESRGIPVFAPIFDS